MRNRLRALDARTIAKTLRYFGFILKTQKGSHQHWVNSQGKRVDLVAEQRSFSRGTLGSMIRQSGRSQEEWVEALENC